MRESTQPFLCRRRVAALIPSNSLDATDRRVCCAERQRALRTFHRVIRMWVVTCLCVPLLYRKTFRFSFAFSFPNSVVSPRIPRTKSGRVKSRDNRRCAKRSRWSSVTTSRPRHRIKRQSVQRRRPRSCWLLYRRCRSADHRRLHHANNRQPPLPKKKTKKRRRTSCSWTSSSSSLLILAANWMSC